jgi:hypothetical protein
MILSEKENSICLLQEQVKREDAHTERQCAKILKENKLAQALLPGYNIDGQLIFVGCEQFCSIGRVDLILIADKYHVSGEIIRVAYIWELKAPQLFIFIMESRNRANPSADLFKAEHQLLLYYNAICDDIAFKTRWNISPLDVHLGGIVIGRENKFIDYKSFDPLESKGLAKQAHDIRKCFFYQDRFSLINWDQVLFILKSLTRSHEIIESSGKSQ